jgi:hypothetical protein
VRESHLTQQDFSGDTCTVRRCVTGLPTGWCWVLSGNEVEVTPVVISKPPKAKGRTDFNNLRQGFSFAFHGAHFSIIRADLKRTVVIRLRAPRRAVFY